MVCSTKASSKFFNAINDSMVGERISNILKLFNLLKKFGLSSTQLLPLIKQAIDLYQDFTWEKLIALIEALLDRATVSENFTTIDIETEMNAEERCISELNKLCDKA